MKVFSMIFFIFCFMSAFGQGFNSVLPKKVINEVKIKQIDFSNILEENPKAENIKFSQDSLNSYRALEDTNGIDVKFLKSLPLDEIIITSGFGERIHPITGKKSFHRGVDLKAKYSNIYAIAPGRILSSGYDKKLGYYVKVKHGTYVSIYGHLSKAYVYKDDLVVAGDIIGMSGNSGLTTGSHLHFSIKRGHQYINPVNFLSSLLSYENSNDLLTFLNN